MKTKQKGKKRKPLAADKNHLIYQDVSLWCFLSMKANRERRGDRPEARGNEMQSRALRGPGFCASRAGRPSWRQDPEAGQPPTVPRWEPAPAEAREALGLVLKRQKLKMAEF